MCSCRYWHSTFEKKANWRIGWFWENCNPAYKRLQLEHKLPSVIKKYLQINQNSYLSPKALVKQSVGNILQDIVTGKDLWNRIPVAQRIEQLLWDGVISC